MSTQRSQILDPGTRCERIRQQPPHTPLELPQCEPRVHRSSQAHASPSRGATIRLDHPKWTERDPCNTSTSTPGASSCDGARSGSASRRPGRSSPSGEMTPRRARVRSRGWARPTPASGVSNGGSSSATSDSRAEQRSGSGADPRRTCNPKPFGYVPRTPTNADGGRPPWWRLRFG